MSARWWPALPWLLLLAAVADWLGLKTGALDHPPHVLALLVAAVLPALALRLFQVGRRVRRRAMARGRAWGEALVLVGILTALSGGSLNWLLGVQGFLILQEGEKVPLHGGAHLQAFVTGPLARMTDVDLALGLEKLELLPAGKDFFHPRSHLLAERPGQAPQRLNVDRLHVGSSGPLRFHQGAFGFAPRIVILQGEQTVFDRHVPFLTRRHGNKGVTFSGRFTVSQDSLAVQGEVDLSTLDEGMRGHAVLALVVRREEQLLGRGHLRVGHFADLEEGYRVGFAGLGRWSEIVISRRTYSDVLLAGGALALAGALLWPLAVWRGC